VTIWLENKVAIDTPTKKLTNGDDDVILWKLLIKSGPSRYFIDWLKFQCIFESTKTTLSSWE